MSFPSTLVSAWFAARDRLWASEARVGSSPPPLGGYGGKLMAGGAGGLINRLLECSKRLKQSSRILADPS